jgi:hypothetical protein
VTPITRAFERLPSWSSPQASARALQTSEVPHEHTCP